MSYPVPGQVLLQWGTSFVTFCLLPWVKKPFQNGVYLIANSIFEEITPLEKGGNMKMADLLPLKVYPGT